MSSSFIARNTEKLCASVAVFVFISIIVAIIIMYREYQKTNSINYLYLIALIIYIVIGASITLSVCFYSLVVSLAVALGLVGILSLSSLFI
jgi:hypothetical protein